MATSYLASETRRTLRTSIESQDAKKSKLCTRICHDMITLPTCTRSPTSTFSKKEWLAFGSTAKRRDVDHSWTSPLPPLNLAIERSLYSPLRLSNFHLSSHRSLQSFSLAMLPARFPSPQNSPFESSYGRHAHTRRNDRSPRERGPPRMNSVCDSSFLSLYNLVLLINYTSRAKIPRNILAKVKLDGFDKN